MKHYTAVMHQMMMLGGGGYKMVMCNPDRWTPSDPMAVCKLTRSVKHLHLVQGRFVCAACVSCLQPSCMYHASCVHAS